MLSFQTTGLKRDGFDKYYTKPHVVEEVMHEFKKVVPGAYKHDIFIEPAAGSGAFVSHLKCLSNRVYMFDIRPEHKEVVKQDYLSLDISPFLNSKLRVHVIGNPPFGKQSSLAKKFIQKSTLFADTIAFILPRSFKKTSMQTNFPLNWHLVANTDLKSNSFTVNDQDLDVPSVFQVWVKQDTKKRHVSKKLKPVGFNFVKKDNLPDFSVRRVGFYAGSVDSDVENKNEETHLFVRVTNRKKIQQLQSVFASLKFKHKNTVGPRSVSKQEILKQLPREYREVV